MKGKKTQHCLWLKSCCNCALHLTKTRHVFGQSNVNGMKSRHIMSITASHSYINSVITYSLSSFLTFSCLTLSDVAVVVVVVVCLSLPLVFLRVDSGSHEDQFHKCTQTRNSTNKAVFWEGFFQFGWPTRYGHQRVVSLTCVDMVMMMYC